MKSVNRWKVWVMSHEQKLKLFRRLNLKVSDFTDSSFNHCVVFCVPVCDVTSTQTAVMPDSPYRSPPVLQRLSDGCASVGCCFVTSANRHPAAGVLVTASRDAVCLEASIQLFVRFIYLGWSSLESGIYLQPSLMRQNVRGTTYLQAGPCNHMTSKQKYIISPVICQRLTARHYINVIYSIWVPSEDSVVSHA